MKRYLGWLLVLFMMLVLALLQGPEEGTTRVVSTYSTEKNGVKALYLLLGKLGVRTERLLHYFDTLPSTDALLVTISPEHPLSSEEARNLRDWVKSGGRVLWIDSEPSEFLSLLHVNVIPDANPGKGKRFTTPDLFVPGGARIDPAVPIGARARLEDAHGVIFLDQTVGAGRVYVLTAPAMFDNEHIRIGDNAYFLAHVLEEERVGSVIFDEYHHGMARYRAFTWFLTGRVKAVLFQGSLACLLFFYWLGRRFGPVRPLPVAPRRSGTEFVGALANLYVRARARPLALRLLFQAFRWQMEKFQAAAAAFQARTGRSQEEFQALLTQYEEKIGRPLSERELLQLAQNLEKLRRELVLG